MAPLSEAFSSYSAVIVTGGSSGIGKSFIELLETLNPALCFCNLSRRKPDLKSGGLNLRHLGIDLTEPGKIDEAAASLGCWLEQDVPPGKLLLINNSGFGGYGTFPEPGLEHQLEMIDLNVRAVVALTGRLLPRLRARGGAIITVASTASFQPTAFMSVYGATKVFVLHWSLALDQELRGTGVRALAVCPGPTATNFFHRAGLKTGSVSDALSMSSEAVALSALRALAAGRSLVTTGWKNKLGAVLMGLLPKTWAARVARWILAHYRLRQVAR
jgi:short-subunit dehydrogenase